MASNLYQIKFTDGTESQEYGSSIADVREFLDRCYSHQSVESIELYNPEVHG